MRLAGLAGLRRCWHCLCRSLSVCAKQTTLSPRLLLLSFPPDSPFYLILNLAVGGPNTIFTDYQPLGDTLAQPKQLLVDWVRVHGLPYALSQAQR